MAFKPKYQGIVNAASDPEDAADRASEPNGEPANEAATNPVSGAPTDAENGADISSEPSGEPANEAAMPSPQSVKDAAESYTPEQQAYHDQMLLGCHKLMYSKAGFAAILNKLNGGKQDIGFSIGHTLAMLLLSMQNEAMGQGQKIPDEVVLDVGIELLSDFIQIAVSSGVLKKEFVEKATARATFCAFKAYGDGLFQQGHVSGEDIKGAQDQLRSLGIDPKQAADATGATAAGQAHLKAAQARAPAQPAPPAPPAAPPPGAAAQPVGV